MAFFKLFFFFAEKVSEDKGIKKSNVNVCLSLHINEQFHVLNVTQRPHIKKLRLIKKQNQQN